MFLPGKFYGQRNLAGYSSRGYKELDETEHACARTHTHTHTHTHTSVSVLFYSIFFNTYLLNSNCVLWKFREQEDWITVNNLRKFRTTVKPASRGLYLGLHKTQGFEDSAKRILMKGHNLLEGLLPLFYHRRAF